MELRRLFYRKSNNKRQKKEDSPEKKKTDRQNYPVSKVNEITKNKNCPESQ